MTNWVRHWAAIAMRRWGLGLAIVILASCGGPDTTAPAPRVSISPEDFVLVPCGPARVDRPCVLAVAGGKRILFGAPAGVSATLADADLRQLDAVMLFSLHAVDIEGLDEVRNASWRAGRSEPLLVVGPEGTVGVVEALNAAFEQADALRVVEEGIPPGGYDAAVLVGREVLRDASAPVFDTGDVRVRGGFNWNASGGGLLILEYRTLAEVIMSTCRGTEWDETVLPDVGPPSTRIACSDELSDLSWPLGETIFIVKSE